MNQGDFDARRETRLLQMQRRLGDELAGYLSLTELRAYCFFLGRGYIDEQHCWRSSDIQPLRHALARQHATSHYDALNGLVDKGVALRWERGGEKCYCLVADPQPNNPRGRR